MNDFAILELFMCQFKDEIISFSITTHSVEKHLSQKYAKKNMILKTKKESYVHVYLNNDVYIKKI